MTILACKTNCFGVQNRLFWSAKHTVLAGGTVFHGQKSMKKRASDGLKPVFEMLNSRFSVVKIFRTEARQPSWREQDRQGQTRQDWQSRQDRPSGREQDRQGRQDRTDWQRTSRAGANRTDRKTRNTRNTRRGSYSLLSGECGIDGRASVP